MTYKFATKTYYPGALYKYEDLPPTAQEDARNSTSTEEDLEGYGTAQKHVYEFAVIPHAQAKKAMDRYISRLKLKNLLTGRIEELADSIRNEGLWCPPAGAEGFHRTMALLSLGMDVPYFRILEKNGRQVGGSFFPK